MTCVIDARLEERWFWVYFSLSQIVYVQLISQKEGHACGTYDSMSQEHEVPEKKRMFLVLFLQVFAKWIGRGVREKQ